MNLIKQVLKDINSNKVEYMPLGKLVKIETGKLNANAAVADGEFMFFTTATEPSRIDKYRWDTEALLIAGNANVGAVQHYKGKFEAYQRTYVLTEAVEVLDIRFLYYILCNGLGQYLSNRSKKAAMTYIVLSDLQNFPVPIPPLPVQEEIVRILDTFTELIAELKAELKAELAARKKQYEFYRENLLGFEGRTDVEYKKVKEVYKRIKGTPITAGKMKAIEAIGGDIRIFAGGQTVVDAFEVDIPKANITRVPAVLVQSRGLVDIVYYDKPFTFKNEMWAYTAEDKITVKYLYHVLKNRVGFLRDIASSMGSFPQISLTATEDMLIPIPSLAEQERIVSILDQFDTLTNSLTEGIPAEIELRQKQYEFYREKLLTF